MLNKPELMLFKLEKKNLRQEKLNPIDKIFINYNTHRKM